MIIFFFVLFTTSHERVIMTSSTAENYQDIIALMISASRTKNVVLSLSDEYELVQLAKIGDKKATNKLLLANTGFIISMIKLYYRPGLDMEDMFQIASIAFIKKISVFIPGKMRLITFAAWDIRNALGRYRRKQFQHLQRFSNNALINSEIEELIKSSLDKSSPETALQIFDCRQKTSQMLKTAIDETLSPEEADTIKQRYLSIEKTSGTMLANHHQITHQGVSYRERSAIKKLKRWFVQKGLAEQMKEMMGSLNIDSGGL